MNRKTCRTIWLAIFAIIMLALFSCCAYAEEELIYNGSFEVLDEYGEPEGWYTDAYIHDEGYSIFQWETDPEAPDGQHYVTIRNEDLNDARYVQTVEVEPESIYHIRFKVRAEDVREGHGANVSVEGLFVFSEGIYETDGEWQTVDWYGETGEEQDIVTLYVRLGGYSGESTGKASFDEISMVRTDTIPGDIVADRWYRLDTGIDDEKLEDDGYEPEETNFRIPLIVISLLYPLLFIALLKTTRREHCKVATGKRYTGMFAVFMIAAMLLRIVLSAKVDGYAVDVNCFLSWGNTMRLNGPVQFYQSTGFCDYPPAYTYILALNSAVSTLLKSIFGSIDPEIIERIVFRFIPSLADIAICILIRERMNQQGYTGKTSCTIAAMLAFFPVSILNSACWGQMDSVLCLLLLLVAVWATENKWQLCLPAYMLAVLVKPQALMLGPLGLTVMIIEWIRHRDSRKQLLLGLCWALLTAAVIVIPFTVRQDPFWLIDQYQRTLASYPYVTVNTANFYYPMGGNWQPVKDGTLPAACFTMAALSAFYFLYLLREKKRKGAEWLRFAEMTLSAGFTVWFAICGFTGNFSWNVVGWSAMAYAFVITLPPLIRSGEKKYLSLYGGLLFILLYVFGIKMHERYLIPAFALLMYAWVTLKDDRILFVLLGSGLTVFLNEGIVLDNSIRLGSSLGHLNNDTEWLANCLSLVNIWTAIGAITVFRKVTTGEKTFMLKEITGIGPIKERSSVIPDNRSLRWGKKDTLLVLVISAVYALITFTTLGSTKAPQNAWISSSPDEEIVIDLGSEYEDFTMLYFARVGRSDFSVAVSYDGKLWSDTFRAQMNQGECYRWKYLCDYWEDADGNRNYISTGSTTDARKMSGRYVKIISEQIGLPLCEVIFRDAVQEQINGCTVISQTNAVNDSPNYSDASALLDEQDTFEAIPDLFGMRKDDTPQPCWYNGTYFDEIYHARTAYEHLHGTVPYETSHPPLGKLIMSLGVMLFGMTPFGWRFTGALAGVLMIPAIYVTIRQLTKKTKFAAIGAFLIAADCMHLTQTQIATIDSYPVLFIIISWFFMLRFIQTDIRKTEIRKILPDLAMSGLFMGLGIASKWIGIYSGAGLAIIYFWHGIRCIRCTAGEAEKKEVFGKFVKLCLYCLIFFILIPAIIYLLCYIPYFAYDKSIRDLATFLKRVMDSQNGMFNYHSQPGLGMDHPFYSPWYEWPISKRPMYYASGNYISAAEYDSSIFSFGNPAVWLAAIPCFLFGLMLLIRERCYRLDENGESGFLHLESADHDPTMLFMTVGFLAQFLPWVLVPRGTYIYHYFASIPFLILFIVITLYYIDVNFPKVSRILIPAYLGMVIVLFIGYFPYASGILTPVGWLKGMEGMKWLINVYY